jgi:hypothetical protein
VFVAPRFTTNPLLLVRVTVFVDTTAPVYPVIQFDRYRFVESRLPAAWP